MTDLIDELIGEETFFDDDTMLEMLQSEPEQACAIVWASARSLCARAQEDYTDLRSMPDDLKNAYIVAMAMDMVVQGMQELITDTANANTADFISREELH